MTTANNPIATRVQSHKQQAKGMLAPSLRVSAPVGQKSHLPAIFTHFSVGKAREASQKMRILNHRRMGKLQAEISKTFSHSIPQKFKEVPKLLHLNPKMSHDGTIWSETERTLPTQGGTQYEEPAQPGELRAGSVIQKFSITPKQGQSIDSFKEEMKSLPRPQSIQQIAPQKPKIDRSARLFSRVQEVSSSQQPITDTTDNQAESSASAETDIVQREMDIAQVPPPEKTPVRDQPQSNEDILKTLVEAMDGPSESSQQVEKSPKPPIDQPVKKLAQPTQPKPDTEPKTDTPLPKALPSARSKTVEKKSTERKETALPTPKALPVAKPTASSKSIVQRKVDVPTAKPTAKTAPSKPKETTLATSAPPHSKEPPSMDVRPATEAITSQDMGKFIPKIVSQEQAISDERSAESSIIEDSRSPSAQKAGPALPPSEMPLRRKIQKRRTAPKAIKTLRPEMLKTTDTKPLLAPPTRPLLSPEKYTRRDASITSKNEPAVQRQSEHPAPQISLTPASAPSLPEGFDTLGRLLNERTEQSKSAPSLPSASQPAEPMRDSRQNFPLAKIPRITQINPQKSQKQTELIQDLRTQLTQKGQKQEEQRLQQEQSSSVSVNQLPRDIPVTKQKVVQRQVDYQTGEGDKSEPKEKSKPEAQRNLEQLAEDVLPYVKRILEIESERVPGNLR